MGILGIIPFLSKHAPHVFTTLPGRFASITGKTVAIDATLLTQRFWFSGDPHNYRHVRGWFRLISELKKSNVDVICIFDGVNRSDAKAREMMRRRTMRKLVAARSALEVKRLRRLERILSTEERYCLSPRDLDEGLAKRIMEALQGSISPLKSHRSIARRKPPSEDTIDLKPSSQISCQVSNSPTPTKTLSEQKVPSASYFTRLAVLYREFQRDTIGLSKTTIKDSDSVSLLDTAESQPEQPTHQASTEPGTSTPEKTTADLEDAESSVALSKLQSHLVTEEIKIWSSILDEPQQDLPKQEERANEIIQRLRKLVIDSQAILDTYKKQSPPTSAAYAESRIILDAMRVPVVEAPYPYEAEGVASSLCINGLADFVISEDTDVLVYGATLLRNASNREDPIVRISGEEVRQALNLTPESFIDLALLMGSDFSERLLGLGPTRATKLIQTFGSIEELLRSERSKEGKGRRYLPEPRLTEEAYLGQIAEARGVFGSLPPIPSEWPGYIAEVRALPLDDAKVAEVMRGFDLNSEYRKETDKLLSFFEDDYYAAAESGFYNLEQGPDFSSTYV